MTTIISIILLYFAIGRLFGFMALLNDAENDYILMIVFYWLPCILACALTASFNFLYDFFSDLYHMFRKKGGNK